MTRKENLYFEMENLFKVLEEQLKNLETGEMDETAYLKLNDGLFSVTLALRYYFGEEPYGAAKQTTILIP